MREAESGGEELIGWGGSRDHLGHAPRRSMIFIFRCLYLLVITCYGGTDDGLNQGLKLKMHALFTWPII